MTRDELLEILPTGMIWAELGTFKGDYSKKILKKTDPELLYMVDIWKGEWESGDVVVEDMYEEYKRLNKKYSNVKQVELRRMTTEKFLEGLKDKELDSIYIDADHRHDPVQRDLNMALNKTKLYIIGHDYCVKKFPDVVKAVDTFCAENGLQIDILTDDKLPTYLIKL